MRLEYHPAVALELRAIAKYYDARSPGLGEEFLGEFERLVFNVAATPRRWRVLKGDIRRCLMKRFPYVICYRLTDEAVRVTVVKHQRRHPLFGMERR